MTNASDLANLNFKRSVFVNQMISAEVDIYIYLKVSMHVYILLTNCWVSVNEVVLLSSQFSRYMNVGGNTKVVSYNPTRYTEFDSDLH